jgi:hypothetical protein
MDLTLSTEERLERVDREVVSLQEGFVEAVAQLQKSPEVDGSFDERWQSISDRLRNLRTGLDVEDFDKEQVGELAGILLDIRDSIDAINEVGGRNLDVFDQLLVLLERIRHTVRDALDEHVAGSRRDLGLVVSDVDRWMPNTTRQEIAELFGVDRRTLPRWRGKATQPSRRVQTVAQLIAILRHNWTEEGIVAWFHRPRRDLDGRAPLAVLADPDFDEDVLISAARAGRSQYAG